MSVQFILGRAGSGKTHCCLEAIRAELRLSQRGPALMLLVPEQATYQTERALATTPGLGGYCRAFVLSFRRLAYQVLLEVGGSALPPLEAAGKQMVLRSILRRRSGDLRLFEKSARQRGFIERLAATLAEMRSYGHWGDRLNAELLALEQKGEGDSLLAAKIHDLAVVVEEYERCLAERYVDPDSYLDLLAARLDKENGFHGARVWIDGFASFTGQEERVLGALMRIAAEVKIALCLDPQMGGEKREAGGKKLEAGGWRREAGGERQEARSEKQESRRIESEIENRKSKIENPNDLSMFALPRETYERLNDLARSSGQLVFPPRVLPEPDQPTRFLKTPVLAALEKRLFVPGRAPTLPGRGRAEDDSNPKSKIQNPKSEIKTCSSEVENRKSKIENRKSVVALTAATDQRCEVRDVACEILRLCRDEGYHFREIAVIVRDLTPYRALIETIFHDYEIPHFLDVRRDVAHHPLVELVRSALAVARGWRSQDVIRYAKTDLVTLGETGCQPILRAAVDQLENYVLEHGIEGDAWYRAEPWRFQRRYSLGEDSENGGDAAGGAPTTQINAWREMLVGPIRRFEQKTTQPGASVLDISRALYGLLDEIGVADRLEQWAGEAERAGRLTEADEHRQVWDAVAELLDQAVAALGNEAIALDEYREIIEAGLENIRLRLVPPALDQVLVGSIERSRHPEIRAAFVLGLNERMFPQPHMPDVIFGDHERERLLSDGLSLGPVSEKRLVHEQFLAYIAFTRPSERLYVSYAEADPMGKVLHPSPYVGELKKAAIGDQPSAIGTQESGIGDRALAEGDAGVRMRRIERDEPLERIAHWRAALAGLAAGLRSGLATSLQPSAFSLRPTWMALYGAMRRDGRLCEPLARRVGGLAYENRARLSLPVARRLYGDRLAATAGAQHAAPDSARENESSVSRLETFAACPFRHFVRHGLGLEERLRFRLEHFDLGLLYHAVLKDVFEQLSEGKPLDWGTVEPRRAIAAVAKAIERIAPQLRNEILLSSGRNRYLLDSTRAALATFLQVLIEGSRRDNFRQAAAEVAFGRGEKNRYGALEIVLAEGERLLLRGRIDRIDVAADNPQTIRIIDYKSRSRKFRLNDLAHGLALQLPAYLLAVERGAAGCGKRPIVAGALYVPILRGIQTVAPGKVATDAEEGGTGILPVRNHGQDAHATLLDLKAWKARGIFEFRWASLFDHVAVAGKGQSPVVALFVTKEGKPHASEAYDALPDGAVADLLRWTEKKLAETGRAILAGEIAVSPYRLANEIACQWCDFQPVCRFDGQRQPYRALPLRRRNEALDWIRERMKADG
jgi:ATP-dependent helicase/nuclease subunit B